VSQNSPTTPASGNQGFNALRLILVIAFLIGEFALISVALRGAIPPAETREVSAYSPWSEEVLENRGGYPRFKRVAGLSLSGPTLGLR
jgi:hypothetical protein